MSFALFIAGLTFVLVSAGAYAGLLQLENRLHRAALLRRLARSGQDVDAYERQRLREPARNILMRLGVAAMPRTENELVDRRRLLTYAGFRSPHAPTLYYGGKLGLALAMGLGYLMLTLLSGTMAPKQLVFAFFPMTLGYYLPGIWLNRRVGERQSRIFHELPDALDLLLICMEAGLSFDMALNRVSRELRGIAPTLAAEFSQYFVETQSGLPRNTVLRNLADRNGEKGLAGVVQVLLQSVRFGTDIAEALKVYSDGMRVQRRQLAEEKGAKISIRLTFPMILLVLPALMLIILGPAFINLVERLF